MARPYSVDLRERVVACERPPRQLRRRFFSINPKFLLSPNVSCEITVCSNQQPPEELLDTVAAVASGRMVFPYLDLTARDDNPLAELTEREREILGGPLEPSDDGTARQELPDLCEHPQVPPQEPLSKLGVSDRAQAVAFYLSRKPLR
jgi:hypothetical protein